MRNILIFPRRISMKNITIKGFNNLSLNCYLFEPKTTPKAVVQIIHGMQEHGKRYQNFAEFLCENGFVVFVSDLRGHGKSLVSENKLGFGEKDIFSEIIEDQKIITNHLKEKYNLPIYVFGHSFGSFITQKFMQVCHIPEKFVVCGTSFGGNALYGFAKILANTMVLFGKKDKPATMIENMSLNAYGIKFKNGNWLSRDEENFKKYQADPLCGVSFPVSFYKSMFTHLTKLNKGVKNIPADKKIFLIAGSKDPVGNNSKDVLKLFKFLKKKNKNVDMKIYEDARHELLNETNKDEVFKDVLNFFNAK